MSDKLTIDIDLKPIKEHINKYIERKIKEQLKDYCENEIDEFVSVSLDKIRVPNIEKRLERLEDWKQEVKEVKTE